MALVGLGGIGKTQIALRFVHAVKQNYPAYSIFWVPALSMETCKQAYEDIARAIGIRHLQDNKEDIRKLVQERLSTKAVGKWLLIIDNADDVEMLDRAGRAEGILDFLPQSDDGLTVFTTRHSEVAQLVAGSDIIEVKKMERKEAVALLEKALVQKRTPYNNAFIIELLTELDFLPLAITQAAAYINTNKSSVSEYLQLLKNTQQDAIAILSREFGDGTRYRDSVNAVAKTWMITFNQILKHNDIAADLLAFISCIEWKAIPLSILPTVYPKSRMADAVGTLCAYSFLEERAEREMLDMHRLVHLATKIWMVDNGRDTEIKVKAVKHLSEVFPFDDYINRKIWREYLPHTARVDKNISGKLIAERSKLCLKVGRCLYVDGRMKEAVLWLQKSYKWREQNLAEDDPDRLASQHELARAYQANGQVQKAVELLEHVVAIGTKVLVEDHPSRLASQHELARAYQANGQVQKAVELLEHVVAIGTKVLAEDHPSRLASQHVLAGAYQANGQVQKAVELLEHVVAIGTKVLAEDHPSRLASQHELARAYRANGQVQKAVELLEHVVAIRTKVLAEDHPDQLASQQVLAGAYQANGQVQKAVELLEHVVAIRTKVLAEDHPSRLASQHELARAYQANGQVQKAVELLEHVVAIGTKVLAEDHPSRLASQHELARAYQANGQVQKAVELLEHVIALKRTIMNEQHPSRQVSEQLLATLYKDLSEVPETE
ncbi:MAG: hypothetical protein M1822_008858 [Bathelium mastoideum]|nr:MAG: hypothetical protein M1822_008858 [Bathelium mastoideum]